MCGLPFKYAVNRPRSLRESFSAGQPAQRSEIPLVPNASIGAQNNLWVNAIAVELLPIEMLDEDAEQAQNMDSRRFRKKGSRK